MYDFAIIGAGIVGLSVAMQLSKAYPDQKVIVLEKEEDIAMHQTGRNSGVIHSGIYYKPGSLKADFAKNGNQNMVDFCHKEGIPFDRCGKLIVAINESELTQLEQLYQRGLQNGIPVEKVNKEQIHAYEPYLDALAGIYVPTTAIVDFKQVARAYANKLEERQGELVFGAKVVTIDSYFDYHDIGTSAGSFKVKYIVNCAGLYSDKIAELAGIRLDMKIVPFRGEYFEIKSDQSHLVKNLVYPVPDPDFPFLGIHFTRMMDGGVTIGPNAVPGLKREGYKKTDIDIKEMSETLRFKPFWQIAFGNMSEGLKEVAKSFSERLFLKHVNRYFPQIRTEDIVPTDAGVRAQALDSDGHLLVDFFIARTDGMIHVCNAPSPAATASLEIGEYIVNVIREAYD